MERAAGLAQEVGELPEELVGAAAAVRAEVEGTAAARWAVGAYLWLLERAPKSTSGKVLAALFVVAAFMAPSLALLYFTLEAGSEATQTWFGQLGYAGVFLANLASTATVFIPVPGLTAAAQALIASSGEALSPAAVGVLGGLGMAIGEVTAYVAGMAGSTISREEHLKAPPRLRPAVEWTIARIRFLMHRFGMPTLFTLSVIPNPLFEVAGLTAGATRFPFWKFMGAVAPGKVTRGLLLAYLGEKLIFG